MLLSNLSRNALAPHSALPKENSQQAPTERWPTVLIAAAVLIDVLWIAFLAWGAWKLVGLMVSP